MSGGQYAINNYNVGPELVPFVSQRLERIYLHKLTLLEVGETVQEPFFTLCRRFI